MGDGLAKDLLAYFLLKIMLLAAIILDPVFLPVIFALLDLLPRMELLSLSSVSL